MRAIIALEHRERPRARSFSIRKFLTHLDVIGDRTAMYVLYVNFTLKSVLPNISIHTL